ncbi:MAG: hypothetical protein EPN72_04825 [Nevskiaceae bacterium]|nr:MAG: hypothetical protein EPN63_07605 [Nevskiaceae bacterium]TBR74118.1 MAG: hypothetical protein EPN72_04825 [Nevskiaceae bacterium]
MAAKNMLDKMRERVERLRQDSLDTATAANKILYNGVHRIADTELKSLNTTYRAALNSLKRARSSGSHRQIVAKQLDILQDAANQVLASARGTLGIVSDTREELTRLMSKGASGGKVTAAQIEKAAQRARTAVNKAKNTAQKVVKNAEKDTKKVVKTARATVAKAEKSATKKVKSAEKTVKKAATGAKKTASKAATQAKASVKNAKKTVKVAAKRARPTPQSRASAATSRAKKAAETVAHTATAAVTTVTDKLAGS